jgi:trehalose-phosphatase
MELSSLAEAFQVIEHARWAGRPLALFSDFDGTLVEIDDAPFDIYPTAKLRDALTQIATATESRLAVISGRDLADLRPRVGVEAACYAGNHGLELVGPDWAELAPGAEPYRAAMEPLIPQLEAAVRPYPGAWVQNKGLTASVHYRQMPPELAPTLNAAIACVVAPVAEQFQLRAGKMVLEVRPRLAWHKGSAAQFLIERWNFPSQTPPLALFLGDDLTDEDGFAAFPDGVTILVGEPRATAARYHAENPEQIACFLHALAKMF